MLYNPYHIYSVTLQGPSAEADRGADAVHARGGAGDDAAHDAAHADDAADDEHDELGLDDHHDDDDGGACQQEVEGCGAGSRRGRRGRGAAVRAHQSSLPREDRLQAGHQGQGVALQEAHHLVRHHIY